MGVRTRQVLAGIACGIVGGLYILGYLIFVNWIDRHFTADIALGGEHVLFLTFAYIAINCALGVGFFQVAHNINHRLHLVSEDSNLFIGIIIATVAGIGTIGFFFLQPFLANLT